MPAVGGAGVAIDNTGLLDGYHHGDPPSPRQIALHVRGARLQGGNVVWRAPGAARKEPVGDAGLGLGLGLPAVEGGQEQEGPTAAAAAAVVDGGDSASSRGMGVAKQRKRRLTHSHP